MSEKMFVDKLTEILCSQGAVNQKEAEALKKDFHERSQASFDFFLVDEGLVTKKELLKALSTYYRVPAMDLFGQFFDHDLIRNFPKDFLLEYTIIPFEIDEDILTVVAANPGLPELAEKINEYTDYDIVFLVGETQEIRDSIREFYDEPPEGYIRDLTDEDEIEDDEMQDGMDVDDYIEKKGL